MKLLFVGDVMLGRLVNEILKTRPPFYPWGDTLPIFKDADWRACNLECALSDRGVPWAATPKAFHFRSDAKNIEVLKAARIDCVSLANNHLLDFEYEAMFDTVSLLQKGQVCFSGAGKSWQAASSLSVGKAGGLQIGFLAFTDNEPGWEAGGKTPGVFYAPCDLADRRTQNLLDLVKMGRTQVDLMVVSAHWGPNWGYQPLPEHRELSHELIQAGADIVFGHSPHVFRGVEVYQGGVIMYSCGDFVDDYAVDEVEPNDQSFIFVIETEKKTVKKLLLYPTIISDFQARLAKGGEARNTAKKMQELCKALGTEAQWKKERYLEINLAK